MVFLAIASGISVVNSPEASVAILQAMVLFGALACAIYLYLGRPDQRWYAGRAVAESIKTSTWRYISKAEPFDHADEIDQPAFGLKLKEIVDQNKEIAGLLVTHLSGLSISGEMTRLRQASAVERLKYYRTNRIVEQQSWYANKAVTNQKMVDRYFFALFIVIGIALFFAIAKIKHPTAPMWPTDFFVTVAAGVLSWIQAKRFQELSASYTLAAHEISLIAQQSMKLMTDEELSIFVGDSENAFSREHTQWAARKDR